MSPIGLGYGAPFGQLPAPEDVHDRLESVLHGPTPSMDREFFKRFLYDKMLHGQGDDVQMRAAELAAKMFGFLDGSTPDEDAAAPDGANTDVDGEGPSEFELHRPTPFRRVAPDDIDR